MMPENLHHYTSTKENSTNISKESSYSWLRRFLATIAIASLAFAPLNQEVHAVTPTAESAPEVYYGRLANKEETASSVWIEAGGTKNGSGTIVSERVIVTALHIITKIDSSTNETYDPSKIFVFLAGDTNEPAFQVKKIEHLGTPGFHNDKVALILSKHISFTETVKPMKVGTPYMANEFELFAIGHGRSEDGFFSQHPRVAQQLIDYDRSECNYNDSFITKPDPNNPEVIHHGDSGGALYAHIPEDTEEYNAGYYFLGPLSKFCGERNYDENGMPIPDYGAIFQSIFFEDAHLTLAEIIAESEIPPEKSYQYLPSIQHEFGTQINLVAVYK